MNLGLPTRPCTGPAKRGHDHVAKALLDGKYEGHGATVDLRDKDGKTALICTLARAILSARPSCGLLPSRGAKQELQDSVGEFSALHGAVSDDDHLDAVALLSDAPGATAALALKTLGGLTPLALAVERGSAACEAVLRAHGAPG